MNDLIVADYNAIEARGTAWLAGAKDLLSVFARGRTLTSTRIMVGIKDAGLLSPERAAQMRAEVDRLAEQKMRGPA